MTTAPLCLNCGKTFEEHTDGLFGCWEEQRPCTFPMTRAQVDHWSAFADNDPSTWGPPPRDGEEG